MDDATPNPNGILLRALHLISAVSGEMKYLEAAQMMDACHHTTGTQKSVRSRLVSECVDTELNATHVIVVGAHTSNCRHGRNAARLNRYVVELRKDDKEDSTRFAEDHYMRSAAYICKGQECSCPGQRGKSEATLNG